MGKDRQVNLMVGPLDDFRGQLDALGQMGYRPDRDLTLMVEAGKVARLIHEKNKGRVAGIRRTSDGWGNHVSVVTISGSDETFTFRGWGISHREAARRLGRKVVEPGISGEEIVKMRGWGP